MQVWIVIHSRLSRHSTNCIVQLGARAQWGSSDNFVQPTSFDTRPFMQMTWNIFQSTSHWVFIILKSTSFLKLDYEIENHWLFKSFVVWWNLSREKNLKNGNRLKYPHIILINKDAVTMLHAVYHGVTVKFIALNLALWVNILAI